MPDSAVSVHQRVIFRKRHDSLRAIEAGIQVPERLPELRSGIDLHGDRLDCGDFRLLQHGKIMVCVQNKSRQLQGTKRPDSRRTKPERPGGRRLIVPLKECGQHFLRAQQNHKADQERIAIQIAGRLHPDMPDQIQSVH